MGSAIRLIASAVGGLALLAGWLVALDYAFDGDQATETRLVATLGLLLAGALALLAIRWTVLQAERDRPGSAQIGSGEVLITGGFMLLVVISIQEEAGAPAVIAVAAGFAGYWAWRVRLARTSDSRAFDPGNAHAPTVEGILDRLQLIAKAAPIPLTNNQVRISRRRLDDLAGGLRAAAEAQSLNDAAEAQAMELAELLEGAHRIPGTDDMRIDSDALTERIRMLRAELGLLDQARLQKDGPGRADLLCSSMGRPRRADALDRARSTSLKPPPRSDDGHTTARFMIRHFASPLIGWPLVIIGGFQLSTILGVWCCVGAAAQLGGFTFLWIRHRPLAFDEPEPEPISKSQASTARFGIWFVPVFYVYISAVAVIYVGFSPGLMLVMLGGLILLVNNMLFYATTLRGARKQDRQSCAG